MDWRGRNIDLLVTGQEEFQSRWRLSASDSELPLARIYRTAEARTEEPFAVAAIPHARNLRICGMPIAAMQPIAPKRLLNCVMDWQAPSDECGLTCRQ